MNKLNIIHEKIIYNLKIIFRNFLKDMHSKAENSIL